MRRFFIELGGQAVGELHQPVGAPLVGDVGDRESLTQIPDLGQGVVGVPGSGVGEKSGNIPVTCGATAVRMAL